MKKLLSALVVLILLMMIATCAAAENWYCPQCGQPCSGNFCSYDATRKPDTIGPGSSTSSTRAPAAGSIVTLGTYPQSASGRDRTPIEWLVLESYGSEAMLISRYSLDCQPYNRSFAYVTWETCSLRSWLNQTFFYDAFHAGEQSAIMETRVRNGSDQCRSGAGWRSDGGYDTYDRVFLLSYAECNIYFRNDASRLCSPTAYAHALGAYRDDSTGFGGWWQRSPAYEDRTNLDAAFVRANGDRNGSRTVNRNTLGVRPVIWVDYSRLR